MPQPSQLRVFCCGCSSTGQFTKWENLSNVLNPDETQQLIDGTLFEYRCPKCGEVTHVAYPCIYHDENKQVIVQFVNEEYLDEAEAALKNLQEGDRNRKVSETAGYRHRLVTSQYDLSEKARIFQDGLDDRVIEVMKLMLLQQNGIDMELWASLKDQKTLLYAGQEPNQDFKLALNFRLENGVQIKRRDLEAEHALYEQAELVVNRREPQAEAAYLIDRDWATQIMLASSDDK